MFPYHGEALRFSGEVSLELEDVKWPERPDRGFYLMPDWSLYHNGSMSGYSRALRTLQSEPYVLINRADAQRFQIQDGQMVKIRDFTLKAIVSEDVEPGTLRLPQVFRDINFQQLVPIRRDPETGQVVFEENITEVKKV